MPDLHDYIDGNAKHDDPAVQALIEASFLGDWDGPVTVEDLENAVRLVRNVDAREARNVSVSQRMHAVERGATVIGYQG